MNNQNSTADIEIVYQEPEFLDESVHYNNVDLVREINKLKKQYARLESKG